MIIYETAAAADRIPVIDLSDARAGSRGRLSVARQIHQACPASGVFDHDNHGVPAQVMQAQLAASRRFFAQPPEAKRAVDRRRSPIMRGYEPVAVQTLDEGSPADLKESFMVGREIDPDHWFLREQVPFEGQNLWPDGLPGFREQVELYTRHMIVLGQTLGALLCLSLDLPEDHLAAGLDEPSCSVRMLHYPPRPSDARFNQLGAGAHIDWGFLTILLQDQVGGLEVRNIDGTWVRADPRPGTFVVNLGDMVPRFTNGRYSSNLHRVLNNSGGEDRYSVATFFNPNGLFSFEVAPSCLAPDAPPPPPCSYADHIKQMLARTYQNVPP